MRLYDFSIYAQRRALRQAAQAVATAASHINDPGSVVELKQKVNTWLDLHKAVQRRAS